MSKGKKKRTKKSLFAHMRKGPETKFVESEFDKDCSFLSKHCGPEYIDYCRASWAANVLAPDGCRLTEEEFRIIRGGMPEGFFRRMIEPYVGDYVFDEEGETDGGRKEVALVVVYCEGPRP